MPKITYTHTKGLFQETGSGAYLGLSATTTTAANSTPNQLTAGDAVVLLCDSANNSHRVSPPAATAAGQVILIVNVDADEDAVVRNIANGKDLATIGEGKGCILISTAAGDNWVPVGVG